MADPFFNFEINVEDLVAGVEVVETKIDDAHIGLTILEKTAKQKINKIIHIAQLSWGLIQGMIRAAGGAISMTTRLVVSAAFGAIQTLYPILSAALSGGLATMDFKAVVTSIIGLAQLSSAVVALVQYEAGQKEISLQLRGLNFTFRNMGMMLSGIQM